MNEQWIQQMRQKMADYKRPAPEVSWKEIDQTLIGIKKNRSRQLWLRRIAAAAIMLFIVGIGYYWELQHNEMTLSRPSVASVVSDGNQPENHGDRSRDLLSGENHGSVPVILAATHKTNVVALPDQEPETIIPVSSKDTDTICTAKPVEQELLHAVEKKANPIDHSIPVDYSSDLYQQKNLDNRLTVKAYISSTMVDRQIESFSLKDIYNPAGIPKDSLPMKQAKQSIHHRLPIRFGLSLRYSLNEHWSVESGLLYTRLSSDITMTVDRMPVVTEQHLNYIGIPLNICFEFWKSHHFGLYITASGTIEKRLDACPWQFSINGAVGVEYKLTDYFSLYAEPGLSYFFKDNSSTLTIYQDHPLNFNHSFGLRFHLK